MTRSATMRRDSEDLERQLAGYVRAERINDMCAGIETKRYQRYLRYCQGAYAGDDPVDEQEQYREKIRELHPRALRAYEQRHGVELIRDQMFVHNDERFPIAAVPDAMEGVLLGLTVHICKTEATYEEAVERGVTKPMERHAQVMMLITGCQFWIHLLYWDEIELRQRRLYEHMSEFNRHHAQELELQMLEFLVKTRRVKQ